MAYFLYILASKRNGTLYIGHTNDLARRIFEHRAGAIDGFTKTYKVNRLVHYEVYEDIRVAQQRERSLKRWVRQWKLALIERSNPDRLDLYDTLNR
jgi:putative endonuclease